MIRLTSRPETQQLYFDKNKACNDTGYTDDTEAFKDACNEACSSSPSILLVPRGKVYIVNSPKFSGPCQHQLIV
jgi:hypothetical protein